MMFELPHDRSECAIADKKPMLSRNEAIVEANRCLYCVDAPCIQACPTSIDIPTFIRRIATDDVIGSALTIFEQNMLGESCARVCPVEVLCEGACVYTGWGREPVPIGRLQRYATETADVTSAMLMRAPDAAPRRVALVGAGPASLACAAELVRSGHRATIFEERAFAGGLNTTGIAPYKLHATDALREVKRLTDLGVDIRTGVALGRDVALDDLLREYDAVFIGVGLGSDRKLGIVGEEGPGVFGAVAWIEQMKLDAGEVSDVRGRAVVVIGGGNTAIDAARASAKLGADVTLVYRKGRDAMSAYAHEIDAARQDGVRILCERTPMRFERNDVGVLQSVVFSHGDAEERIRCDVALVAIGQQKREAVSEMRRRPRVFVGGDAANGGKEVVNAVAEGRDAARQMMKEWNPCPT